LDLSRFTRWGRQFLVLDLVHCNTRIGRFGGLGLSRAIAILACTALVSGCASIFEGTTQQILVSTTPSGAICTFSRNGELIAAVVSTPGTATIKKTKDDVVIVCTKPGYAGATFVNKSGVAMVAFANILTAGLAWAIDSSRGADNKYQGEVDLALAPLGVGAPVEFRPLVPSPPSPPSIPGTVPRTRSAPAQAPTLAAPAPAAPQLDCAASDGSRIRVTGIACPAGWTLAR
jgi:hypothetical protein